MSQLQVGQPIANSSGAAAGVLPNHNSGGGAEESADSLVFVLNQPDTAASSGRYTELSAQTEMLLAEITQVNLITAAIAETGMLPEGAEVPESSTETDNSAVITDTVLLPDDAAEISIDPLLLSALNFGPLPTLNQMRTESTPQSSAGLSGFTDKDYSAALLNSSAYNTTKDLPLTGTNTALPVTPMSLQHFIRQATELVRPLSSDTAAVSGVATAQIAASTTSAEPAFQWKADQLGLQSSQWGQKLVYLLSDKINLQLGQQIQRAQIRLDPPQLGLIELSVSVDGDRTTVQLYASNNQMRDAMQQNLEQLRQQLAQRLDSEQLLDIDVRQQSQQQAGQQHAEPEHIAAHFADDVTELSSSASAQLTTGWLNRLI
ncbi:hypothetical protein M2404_003312 [Rheinheimera pacifica]|uniref:flagellar hook-length control protein FliK n=1 Tax=Rheinheimera pacifica TaxID=173990 RepID=UPI002169ED9A|nr:flagellar hook-length control protein FliK [Rheinheimera pacifica]MCS4308950.1 hypothetical protein [Rheinheimera pacifica]